MDAIITLRRAVPAGLLVLLTTSCATLGTPEAEEGAGTEAGAEQSSGPNSGEASGSSSDEGHSGEVRIPQHWLDMTAQEYPDSEGSEMTNPMLNFDDECMLFDEMPVLFEDQTVSGPSGFGPYGNPSVHYGNESHSDENYRYLCDLRASEESRDADESWGTPSVQLMVAQDTDLLEETVEDFLDQNLPAQENDVRTVEIDGAEIHVTQRSFPTNENAGGELQAIFYDEEAQAIFQMRLSSMDEDLWEDHGHEGAAQDLAEMLRG